MLNLARDILGLLIARGYTSAAAVIGHDFGASLAGVGADPADVFHSLS